MGCVEVQGWSWAVESEVDGAWRGGLSEWWLGSVMWYIIRLWGATVKGSKQCNTLEQV